MADVAVTVEGPAVAAGMSEAEAAQKIQKASRKSSGSDESIGREISIVSSSGEVIFQAVYTSDLTVLKLKHQIAEAQNIKSQEVHLSSSRKLANHELIKDVGEDILTFTRVDYVSTLHHAASKIGGAWKRHR